MKSFITIHKNRFKSAAYADGLSRLEGDSRPQLVATVEITWSSGTDECSFTNVAYWEAGLPVAVGFVLGARFSHSRPVLARR